jgi:hypothetical protein
MHERPRAVRLMYRGDVRWTCVASALALLACGGDRAAPLDGGMADAPADVVAAPDGPAVAATPSGLYATVVSPYRVDLSWTDHALDEIYFRIERTPASTIAYVQIGIRRADVTTFSDVTVHPASVYRYRVTAVNEVGGSLPSNPATAVTPEVVPDAPTKLTAAAISGTRIDLAWTDNATNETGFAIERIPIFTGGAYVQIATVAANVTTFSDLTAQPAWTHYYRVLATNSAGSSAPSNEASATTPEVPPAAPTQLVATAVGANEIDLSWLDNSTNELEFVIERSPAGANTFVAYTR